ncbi:hypothetical protein ACOMHN_006319 [Nucella lapillus]
MNYAGFVFLLQLPWHLCRVDWLSLIAHMGLFRLFNFDTQISSQNGHKSTHGLAMILTQANYQKPQLLSQDHDTPRIKRLSKTETKADNLMLGEVKVHRYMGAKKPPMPEEFCQRVVPSLAFLANQQISLNRAATEDLAFFKHVLKSEPEYSGFNTQRARSAGQQPQPKTAVVYSPFLDMVPAEPDTMKTAMVEAQRLTNLTGQEWTVFTKVFHPTPNTGTCS